MCPRENSFRDNNKISIVILFISVSAYFSQIVWFWQFCSKNINFDAISYIGVARHIVDRNFQASINGYWSPLFSWIIALGSFLCSDFTLVARVLTILSFLTCLSLMYILTHKLWNSSIAALLVVLWFVLARGLAPLSVKFILADFLLTSVVLLYFIIMISCISDNRYKSWCWLGVVHSIGFLAKAFALPWLGLTTFFSVLMINKKNLKKGIFCLFLASIAPIMLWVGWGKTLEGKYGVFMSGYQFKKNLLQWTSGVNLYKSEDLELLSETSKIYDKYLVLDPMPPGSELWQRKITGENLQRNVIHNERKNIPKALKELCILVTPGGMIAFLLGMLALFRRRTKNSVEAYAVVIVLFSSASLILAYSLLVLDGRYVIPLVPLIMAISVRFILPKLTPYDELSPKPLIRKVVLLTTIISILFFTIYWASPFRSMADFEQSCYDAAKIISNESPVTKTAVVIGEGPYPNRGVGWEAGIYAAYFANARIVGSLAILTNEVLDEKIVRDLYKLKPDILMVWGNPQEYAYADLVYRLKRNSLCRTFKGIIDPTKGEVGTIFSLHF